jgi:hypothetical protein
MGLSDPSQGWARELLPRLEHVTVAMDAKVRHVIMVLVTYYVEKQTPSFQFLTMKDPASKQ